MVFWLKKQTFYIIFFCFAGFELQLSAEILLGRVPFLFMCVRRVRWEGGGSVCLSPPLDDTISALRRKARPTIN